MAQLPAPAQGAFTTGLFDCCAEPGGAGRGALHLKRISHPEDPCDATLLICSLLHRVLPMLRLRRYGGHRPGGQLPHGGRLLRWLLPRDLLPRPR